jgi:predicted nucleic acid-binding protein
LFRRYNVWLYAVISSQDPVKTEKAVSLIRDSDIVTSTQVVNEICVNLIKKAQFDESSIRKLIDSFYSRYPVGIIDRELLLSASELREKWQLSFWDSLIVASALAGSAEVLYTEDMADGLLIENHLKVTNPFNG